MFTIQTVAKVEAVRKQAEDDFWGEEVARIVLADGQDPVAELDAIDGTPVIDIKPVMREFLPRQATTQPGWATELMAEYWSIKDQD